MKKHFLAAALIGATLLTVSAGKKTPILMNVAGKDVPVTEFEYLYHKNNSQQSEPQTIDQYLGMFINYKLKVADAEAAGLDTTATFREEFLKFRNELAEPYLQDNQVLEDLLAEAYSHLGEEVRVSHIMVREGDEALLDSLRTAIVNGKMTFEDAAMANSVDGYSARFGGKMGVVMPGRFPWAFEEMAYNTGVGEISPIVNSGFGLHIIRVDERTPARGEVKARHILRVTRGATEEMAVRQKALIDSLYTVAVANPDSFEALAKEFSEDPGSARNGGDLGWFGGGAMVAEFDSVAFALPDGAISEPFTTQFGWHIIKKEGSKGVGSLDDNRDALMKQISNGERAKRPVQEYMKKARKKYNARLMTDNLSQIAGLQDTDTNQQLDSTFIATLAAERTPVYVIGNTTVCVSDLAGDLTPMSAVGGKEIRTLVADRASARMDESVREMAREDLINENDDYRNLVNEYRDGILLFEISNTNVWDKASKNREGLEAYFREHKDKYSWDAPKFKSYIIFAANDSMLNAALDYAASLPADMLPTEFVKNIREHFGRDIKIERVIASKGENAITDYLGFGADKPATENGRWKCYAAFGGRIIDAPEEAADVRGAAVADYQEELERQWVSDLHSKYKVKVNKGVLKKVK